ncbi:hypothetical protein P9112_007989 [Eukaryota sp. TZLM1-RC]
MFHITQLVKELPKYGIEYQSLPVITAEELQQHTTPENGIWTVVGGVVFDVTSYVAKHKGGERCITQFAGSDCTSSYAMVHGYINALRLPDFKDRIKGRVSGNIPHNPFSRIRRNLIPPS